MDERLMQAVADLDDVAVFALVDEELAQGTEQTAILGACREGMTVVGQRFADGEYYLSDLIMSGELFKEVAVKVASANTVTGTGPNRGKVVIATVEGDIHDIGKDIVVNLLRGANYDVLDLGVDVPAARVVEAVQSSGAKIVGLSGLLTIAFDPMKNTVQALRGLDLPLKIMVGGAPVTEAVREYVGADARGVDALDAVKIADEWTDALEAGR
jgi:methanogenic corrinoid protein MtbC1